VPLLADGRQQAELLAAASGKSKREVEELMAWHFPQPDVPFSVRKLSAVGPMPVAPTVPASAPVTSAPSSGSPEQARAMSSAVPPPSPHRPVVRPLAPVIVITNSGIPISNSGHRDQPSVAKLVQFGPSGERLDGGRAVTDETDAGEPSAQA
jgi:hypothetical protein